MNEREFEILKERINQLEENQMSIGKNIAYLREKLEQELRRKTKINIQQNDILADHKKEISELQKKVENEHFYDLRL